MNSEPVDNHFHYVVLAARRARQLQNGSPPLIDSTSNKACRVAQDEIAAGKVKAAPKIRYIDEVVSEPETPQDFDS